MGCCNRMGICLRREERFVSFWWRKNALTLAIEETGFDFYLKCYRKLVPNAASHTALLQSIRSSLTLIPYIMWNFRAMYLPRAFLKARPLARRICAKPPHGTERNLYTYLLNYGGVAFLGKSVFVWAVETTAYNFGKGLTDMDVANNENGIFEAGENSDTPVNGEIPRA